MGDDFKLFTTTQRSDETLDEYYKAFKAQGDIINAHGGRAGFHQALFQEHLAKLIVEKGLTMTAYGALAREHADKVAILDGANKSSREAYLACLFLLMADGKRF